MQNLAEKFLTKSEQAEVTAVVRQMERTTSGEIVPMIVARSHHYPLAAVIGSLLLSIPLSLVSTAYIGPKMWVGPSNMWLFFAIGTASFAVFSALAKRSSLAMRFFLNRREVEQEVRKGALAAFYAEKLHKTVEENGILLYISVLEQKVWVLADAGINRRINPSEWDEVVADLTAGIKGGRRSQALCEAIQRIGRILQSHFPHQRDDQDELHNLIIR